MKNKLYDSPVFKTVILVILTASVGCQEKKSPLLQASDFQHYISTFNTHDEELYVQHFPNNVAWDFLSENIPLFSCPDSILEKTYYFRWWTFRKHIKQTEDGFVFTEFLPEVSWSGKHNTINCPAAHHIYEGRWLHDNRYVRDYLRFWLTAAGDRVRDYSFWIADAMLAFQKVHPDSAFVAACLPKLVDNYHSWEAERQDEGKLLFWQYDNRDGMEYTASGRILQGGERVFQQAGTRPSINSYMYGDAKAIATMARHLKQGDLAQAFTKKAEQLKAQVQQRLWNEGLQFFSTLPRDYDAEDSTLNVRELIGYIPWYFHLPDDQSRYAAAWQQVLAPEGFYAPYGLTVCEQRHPYFEIAYEGHECQWNGPSWPFATSQTLTAMANLLNDYTQKMVNKSDYYRLLKQYASVHRRTNEQGQEVSWIDENLNPMTGEWLSRARLSQWKEGSWSEEKGGKERGKDYNHSTFNDLIISGLVGVRPHLGDTVGIHPLIPDGQWDWYCLDRIPYHGGMLGVLWDKTGEKYGRGRGYQVYYNQTRIFQSEMPEPVTLALDI